MAMKSENMADLPSWSGSRRQYLQLAARLGAAVITLITVLTVSTMTTGAVGTGAALQAQNATAQDAIERKQVAQRRLDALETLDDTKEVVISSPVLQSVKTHIKQGKLAMRQGNYEGAVEHFNTAIQQANAALERGYRARAAVLLNASANHLAALDEAGYDRASTSRLEANVERYRENLNNASTLADARRIHSNAEALYAEVKQLPATRTVVLANFLTTGFGPIFVGIVSVGLTAGVFLLGRLSVSRSESEDGDTSGTGGVDVVGDQAFSSERSDD